MASDKYILQEGVSPRLEREWLDLPKKIYRGNRNWVCPLDSDIRAVFDPRRNELFADGEAIRWVARNAAGEVVGRIAALPTFFQHLDQLLTPAGQVLLDSSDLRYLYEDEDGTFEWDETDGYYGELTYSMQYRNVKGASFPWLYLDFPTLERIARAHGFCAELLAEGEHYDYLARLRRVAE